MKPASALALNYTLCAKNGTEISALVNGRKRILYAVLGEFTGGLNAYADKHLVRVVMSATSATTALAVLVMMVMLMMMLVTALIIVMLVMVAVTALILIVLVVVMAVTALILVMLVMVMTVTALILTVLVVMMAVTALVIAVLVMVVAVTALILVVLVMMAVTALILTVLVMVMVMLLLDLGMKPLEGGGKRVLGLHSAKDIPAVHFAYGGGNYNRIPVMLTDKRYRLLYLMKGRGVGVRKHYGRGVGHLIVVELTEVLHIHFALGGVTYGGKAIKHRLIRIDRLYRLDDIRELSDTRGLDNNPLGGQLVYNLLKRLGEVSDQ